MKAFKTLFYFCPLCILVIGVNLSVDPTQVSQKEIQGRHHPNEELFSEKASEIILKGKSVQVPYGFNERLFYKKLISKQTKKKDLAILGSSQTAQLDHTQFPQLDLLNSSILTFTINDILGLVACYERQNLLPKRILIAVEPSLLNETTSSKNALWKVPFEQDVEEIMRKFSLEYQLPKKHSSILNGVALPAILSPSYFQESLYALGNRKPPVMREPPPHPQPAPEIPPLESFEPFATDAISSHATIYRPDGSLSYKDEYNESSEQTAERKAIEFASWPEVHGLEDFNRLDPRLRSIFETLIRYLTQKGTEVTLLLLPYHPETYRRLVNRPDTKIIEEAEDYYLGLKDLGIKVFGSFDPIRLGYGASDFFDHSHLRKNAVQRIQTSEFFTYGAWQ